MKNDKKNILKLFFISVLGAFIFVPKTGSKKDVQAKLQAEEQTEKDFYIGEMQDIANFANAIKGDLTGDLSSDLKERDKSIKETEKQLAELEKKLKETKKAAKEQQTDRKNRYRFT